MYVFYVYMYINIIYPYRTALCYFWASFLTRPLSQIQLLLLALCAGFARAVPTIEIKGSDFINSATGDRFQLLGVAYQPGGSSGFDPASGLDPLSDGDVCLRDAALMQRLGAHIALLHAPREAD